LPDKELDSSSSSGERPSRAQHEEFLDEDDVSRQPAAATGFFSGWFGRRKASFTPAGNDDEPIATAQVGYTPVGTNKRIPDSIEGKAINASERREPSDVDGLEELGEESRELEGEKRKSKFLMKAAPIAVIGGAGAYAVVHRLGQDDSPDDDPALANNADPTSTANNPDTSAAVNPPDASAAVNPPDASAMVTQPDGGAGVAHHASATQYDGGAVVIQQTSATQGDGGAVVIQQTSQSDGGVIFIQSKATAPAQAAAPPPAQSAPQAAQ
jgi:hypothetical protein